MGQAQRRRKADLVRHINKLHDQGQGLWEIDILPQEQLAILFAEFLLGNTAAYPLFNICGQLLKDLQQVKTPILCLLCDHKFAGQQFPAAIVVTRPRIDEATQAIGNLLCDECLNKPNLINRVVEKYREGFGDPSMRIIPPSSEPGHA